MPATESTISVGSPGSKTARIAASGLATAIVVLSLVPPTVRPETTLSHSLEHFTIFAATGFAFGLGYQRKHLLAILLVIFSAFIEIVQLFIPGRHARLSDFIIDAVAACM
jgi:VanZ family protein